MWTGGTGRPQAGSRRAHRAGRLGLILLLAAILVTSGCTYSSNEPGLFRTEAPARDSAPPLPPQPTNVKLPVAGDAVWTTSEGLRVTSRFAIHGIRRIEGATILDWSVTPLGAPDLAAGEPIPGWIDLGLTREAGGDVNIALIDTGSDKVYRPLSHRSRREFNRCLCTPVWVAQLDLRIGETRLLQTSFPKLPAKVRHLDVSLTTLPIFSHVPVAGTGQLSTPVQPTDLRRAPEERESLTPPYNVRLDNGRGSPRVISVEVNSITANERLTWMQWTIRSLTDQPDFSTLPVEQPIAARIPPKVEVYNPGSASGPQLRTSPDRTPLSVQWMTTTVRGHDYYECLCTSIGLWATSLRRAGSSATVVTVYPALPAGTKQVDVILPGATTLWRLPVSRAEDSAARLGRETKQDVGSWEYLPDRPPAGWSTLDWPTPVPETRELWDYESFVGDLTDLPER